MKLRNPYEAKILLRIQICPNGNVANLCVAKILNGSSKAL